MWLWGQFPKFHFMSEKTMFAFVQMKKYPKMVSKKGNDLR